MRCTLKRCSGVLSKTFEVFYQHFIQQFQGRGNVYVRIWAEVAISNSGEKNIVEGNCNFYVLYWLLAIFRLVRNTPLKLQKHNHFPHQFWNNLYPNLAPILEMAHLIVLHTKAKIDTFLYSKILKTIFDWLPVLKINVISHCVLQFLVIVCLLIVI